MSDSTNTANKKPVEEVNNIEKQRPDQGHIETSPVETNTAEYNAASRACDHYVMKEFFSIINCPEHFNKDEEEEGASRRMAAIQMLKSLCKGETSKLLLSCLGHPARRHVKGLEAAICRLQTKHKTNDYYNTQLVCINHKVGKIRQMLEDTSVEIRACRENIRSALQCIPDLHY